MDPSLGRVGRLVPSALLSSRWSRDNLLTPDPARLYNGTVGARVGVAEVEEHLRQLMARRGPFDVTTGGLGVLSWSIRCQSRAGDFLLQLPLAMEAEGVGGRSKRHVPERCFEHARHFAEQGLGRYLLCGEQLLDLSPQLRGATFSLPPGHFPLTFGLGSARVDFEDAGGSWIASFGSRTTRKLTRELLAALAYHYDPDTKGGVAVADILINDGDFLVKRDRDGDFCLRMTCARRLEPGIDRNRFLLFLVQLMAYEDWSVENELIGLPVPVGDPAVAFAGLVQGTGLRYEDLGKGRATGHALARSWIAEFGRSREGRAYEPWVRCFLDGPRSLDPVEEPRRPWWNLVELEQRRDLARLQHDADRARALDELITRLEEVIGVGSIGDVSSGGGGASGVNDWDREEVAALLHRCGVSGAEQDAAVEAWFAGWPYRNRRQLKNQVAALRSAGEHLTGVRVDGVVPADEDGTLRALDRLPKQRPARALANPEAFPGPELPPGLEREAARRFPSFEAFMDDALHDPAWGYYTSRVLIGDAGHFSTNPEALTPHYGRWVASWALEVWSELLATGNLSAGERFLLIEFGAGNGRLARDVIDAVRARRALDARWRAFGDALEYRIYELSSTLRQRQQELLGTDARIVPGDARQPAAALRRDFPSGVRGFIVSNELPDAFGVHKVLLSAHGVAEAVLVVPRLEAELAASLSGELAARCRETDAQLRSTFGWTQHPGEWLLDRKSLSDVMTFIYGHPKEQLGPLLNQLWFEEVPVPASCFEPLIETLRAGAEQYARALAQENSGVVQYVNVHARSYIRDLAQVLTAGQIMTIDYGDTTAGLVSGARRGKFPFRIYCDEGAYHPRANYPYTWPGAQDLTADVNFTDLALAGLGAGLELVYYGPERAITGAELPRVVASAEQKPFAKFVGSSVFKLLVLGRGVAWAPSGEGLEPWPILSEAGALPASISALAERLGAAEPA